MSIEGFTKRNLSNFDIIPCKFPASREFSHQTEPRITLGRDGSRNRPECVSLYRLCMGDGDANRRKIGNKFAIKHNNNNNLGGWRTDRDSNPGDGHPPTHFPGVRLRPLGHLSNNGSFTQCNLGRQAEKAGFYDLGLARGLRAALPDVLPAGLATCGRKSLAFLIVTSRCANGMTMLFSAKRFTISKLISDAVLKT